MGEYFKPLRRKLGVVTLLLACVFAAGWVRSLSNLGALFRLNETNTHEFDSFNGAIGWQRIWPIRVARQSRWVYRHNGNPDFGESTDGLRFHWKYAACGFEVSAFSAEQPIVGTTPVIEEFARWQVSYWAAVALLTLISAWLLLSKERPERPAQRMSPNALD